MKKFLLVLLVLVTIGTTAGMIYFIVQWNQVKGEKENLVSQNAMLQSTVDAIGPTTQAWTVLPGLDIEPGDEIIADHLVQQTVPVSSVTDNYVMSKEELIGKFYKVTVREGTSLTKDLLMDTDSVADYAYERDILIDYLPVGSEVGDYVSFRFDLPYGQEFIIFEKKRIKEINTNTFKIDMSEAEVNIWKSVQTDMAIYKQVGSNVYVVKYNEPGVMEETIPFYPVRQDMYPIVTVNPNIPDKTRLINEQLRLYVDYVLDMSRDEQHRTDAGMVSSQNSNEASSIQSDYKEWLQEQEEAQNAVDSSVSGEGSSTGTGGIEGATNDAAASIDESVGEMMNQPEETID